MLDINLRPEQAVYLQIADHIRRQVALSNLHPGERLPAIRALAKKLNLDPGTVARAYRELEREGIVTSRQGGGSCISTNPREKYLAEQQQKRLSIVVERAILEALGLGFSTEDIERVFALRLADWRERRAQSSAKKETDRRKKGNEIRFMGSHDLAIELLASHLSSLYPEIHVATNFVGSLAGLVAVECRKADIAGIHLMDEDTGEYNIPFVRRLMPNETVVLVNLVQRYQGLMLAPLNPKQIRSIEDLARPDITFVNRQKGSGTRMLLDSQLMRMSISPARVRGYEHEENTHTAVASAIAGGRADVGLGAQSAADVAGLDFIPLLKERYDLVALKSDFDRLPLQRIKEVICTESFRNMVCSIPGYDVSDTGKIAIVDPKGRRKEKYEVLS